MDELIKYYTPIRKQTLQLLDYHLKCLNETLISGIPDAEYDRKLDHLNHLKEMLTGYDFIVDGYKGIEKRFADNLLIIRQNSLCPQCNLHQTVEILGVSKNEVLNITCDWVKCTICSTEFQSQYPNNWKERIVFYSDIIRLFSEHLEEAKKGKFSKAFLKQLKKMMDYIIDLKNDQLKLHDDETIIKNAAQDAVEKVESMRDHLLMAKLKGMNWNDNKEIIN
ncbi:MAG: hypothetical protein WCQ95_00155 [Bacteroidota bacterium]